MDLAMELTPDVSIHAPRVGSDMLVYHMPFKSLSFNPRPPCGERPSRIVAYYANTTFQSTPPVWGATGRIGVHIVNWMRFNPRPQCGERPFTVAFSCR